MENKAIYLRHENMLASTKTHCAKYTCAKDGCQFPHCSFDFQSFNTEKKADAYQRELQNLGHKVVVEEFEP